MSAYTQPAFTQYIDCKNIRTIVECGSRDCLDTITMLNFYNPNIIYSFECNPESVQVCQKNILGLDKIKLIPKAVSDKSNEIVSFYATDMDKSIDKNIGASSILFHRDNEREFFQKEIKVETIALADFMEKNNIEFIDLLCLDLQGYEMSCLKGLREKISKVKYIITEVSFRSFYHGDVLFPNICSFMYENGFDFRISYDVGGFGDALFVKRN